MSDYTLNLKATLDTSEAEQKLSQLNQKSNSTSSIGNQANNASNISHGNVNLTQNITRLSQSIDRLRDIISRQSQIIGKNHGMDGLTQALNNTTKSLNSTFQNLTNVVNGIRSISRVPTTGASNVGSMPGLMIHTPQQIQEDAIALFVDKIREHTKKLQDNPNLPQGEKKQIESTINAYKTMLGKPKDELLKFAKTLQKQNLLPSTKPNVTSETSRNNTELIRLGRLFAGQYILGGMAQSDNKIVAGIGKTGQEAVNTAIGFSLLKDSITSISSKLTGLGSAISVVGAGLVGYDIGKGLGILVHKITTGFDAAIEETVKKITESGNKIKDSMENVANDLVFENSISSSSTNALKARSNTYGKIADTRKKELQEFINREYESELSRIEQEYNDSMRPGNSSDDNLKASEKRTKSLQALNDRLKAYQDAYNDTLTNKQKIDTELGKRNTRSEEFRKTREEIGLESLDALTKSFDKTTLMSVSEKLKEAIEKYTKSLESMSKIEDPSEEQLKYLESLKKTRDTLEKQKSKYEQALSRYDTLEDKTGYLTDLDETERQKSWLKNLNKTRTIGEVQSIENGNNGLISSLRTQISDIYANIKSGSIKGTDIDSTLKSLESLEKQLNDAMSRKDSIESKLEKLSKTNNIERIKDIDRRISLLQDSGRGPLNDQINSLASSGYMINRADDREALKSQTDYLKLCADHTREIRELVREKEEISKYE